MIHLDPTHLERSPQEGARLLCLGLLEEADSALGRLERGDDEEALHDFRVALRRLRSSMRAYRPYLKGSARKKLRGRLKALASSTSAARDREVSIAFLSKRAGEERGGDDDPARAGALRLLERLRTTENPAAPSAEALRKSFDPLDRRLRKSLSRLRLEVEDSGARFPAATGELLAEAAAQSRRSLRAVSSVEDGERLHRARIEAKRLRYLLEPLASAIAPSRPLVKELKELQDILGELQDIRVLMQSISEELERSALEQAQRLRDFALREGTIPTETLAPDRELLSLLREVRSRRAELYEELSRKWLGEASDPFYQRVVALASELSTAFGRPKPVRRFLLSSVPERARRRAPRIIQEAFFPGKRIREQIRSERSGSRMRYFRRVSTSKLPVEESLERESFETMWLVAPKKLERARYEVRDSDRTYWIDELRDGKLVLAETEDGADLVIPDWLKVVVVREVTGSRRYEWESLARRDGGARRGSTTVGLTSAPSRASSRAPRPASKPRRGSRALSPAEDRGDR